MLLFASCLFFFLGGAKTVTPQFFYGLLVIVGDTQSPIASTHQPQTRTTELPLHHTSTIADERTAHLHQRARRADPHHGTLCHAPQAHTSGVYGVLLFGHEAFSPVQYEWLSMWTESDGASTAVRVSSRHDQARDRSAKGQ